MFFIVLIYLLAYTLKYRLFNSFKAAAGIWTVASLSVI
jgi:hypothetical protein